MSTTSRSASDSKMRPPSPPRWNSARSSPRINAQRSPRSKHVRQQVLGNIRLPVVRRTRYTTRHQLRHHRTRPISSHPSSDPPGCSPTRLTLSQRNEGMDPESRRRRRGRRWIHGLARPDQPDHATSCICFSISYISEPEGSKWPDEA